MNVLKKIPKGAIRVSGYTTCQGADFVAKLFGHLRVGAIKDVDIPELASNQPLQIHQRRGSINTMLITHPLKQRLGRRILL